MLICRKLLRLCWINCLSVQLEIQVLLVLFMLSLLLCVLELHPRFSSCGQWVICSPRNAQKWPLENSTTPKSVGGTLAVTEIKVVGGLKHLQTLWLDASYQLSLVLDR